MKEDYKNLDIESKQLHWVSYELSDLEMYHDFLFCHLNALALIAFPSSCVSHEAVHYSLAQRSHHAYLDNAISP